MATLVAHLAGPCWASLPSQPKRNKKQVKTEPKLTHQDCPEGLRMNVMHRQCRHFWIPSSSVDFPKSQSTHRRQGNVENHYTSNSHAAVSVAPWSCGLDHWTQLQLIWMMVPESCQIGMDWRPYTSKQGGRRFLHHLADCDSVANREGEPPLKAKQGWRY